MPKLPASYTLRNFQPNTKQVKQFLTTLDPTATHFLFVAIDNNKHNAPKLSYSPINDNTINALAHMNKQGYNIFVTINKTKAGTARTKNDITGIRCIFADDDGKNPAEPYPLPPSATIETSPGKKQVYWLVDDSGIDHGEWDGVQQTIVNQYGGDTNARDIARILRVPGFLNTKPDYDPQPLCSIKEIPGYRYTWDQIISYFPPSQVIMSTGGVKGEAVDLKSLIEQFVTGTNYHDAGLRLAGYYYNIGIKQRDDLILNIQSMMDVLGDSNDQRFQHRRNEDIPNSVDWVIKKRTEEELKNSTIDWEAEPEEAPAPAAKKYTAMPIPGGGMHIIIEWVMSIMRYPNKVIATIVAEHLVSVFGGGHYHIMQNTTTRKRIMLAPLGSGKNTITRALGMVVRELATLNDEHMPKVLEAEKFIGSDSFSFSTQHKQIEECRVRSFLVNEAGESGKSGAGDIDNLRAYQLQALSTKADEVFMPKKFSEMGSNANDKQMKHVFNGVWVYLHESTIDSYALMLKDSGAFVNGDLSRSDIFFVNPTVYEKNPDIAKAMPDQVRDMFVNLANDFMHTLSIKGEDDVRPWEEIDYSLIKEGLNKLEDEIIQKRNEAYAVNDEARIAMLGRKFERILTSILICATADAVLSGTMEKPVANEHHLTYAIHRADAIEDTLIHHANQGGALGGNPFEAAEKDFIEKFTALAKNPRKYKNKHQQLKAVSNNGYFCWQLTYTIFTKQLERGPYQRLLRDVYRNDQKRARTAFMEHLIDKDIIQEVMGASSNGYQKPVSGKWHMNNHYFPVDPKHVKT